MTLQEFIQSLDVNKQLELTIKLAKLILPVWEKYALNNSLSYYDSVAGLKHSVNKNLLFETIMEIESCFRADNSCALLTGNEKLIKLYKEFQDPVVALQDSDWELYDEAEKCFYSVYNLLEYVICSKQNNNDESTLYVSINQAIDALETSGTMKPDEIKYILQEFKN
jgi:hypothetical protein